MKITLSTLLRKLVPILLIGVLSTLNVQAQVIINEISYRSGDPAPGMDHADMEFIELFNQGGSSVDLSGWFIDDAVSYKFSNGTSIGGTSFLIVAANVSDFNAAYPGNSAIVVGGWSGSLRNSGEDIFLRDDNFNEIDFVDYDNWNEWPSTGNAIDTPSPLTFLEDINWSLQKVNVSLPGNHAGSWDAAEPTPGAFNDTVFDNNPVQRPIIQNVRRSPDEPLSSESVRVRAEFDKDNLASINGLSVQLEYRVLKPGSYRTRTSPNYGNNWTTLTMRDDGNGPDSTANNGVFTAEIPASQHNHRDLVRYRIKVTNNSGFNETYPDQNYRESNYAYYVYNGYPSHAGVDLTSLPKLQDITIVTDATISDIYIGDAQPNGSANQNNNQYQGTDELGQGTLVYNGRVYDHVTFRPRGRGSRRERNKPGIRFDLNREHSFETENDCGDRYDVDRGSLILSGGWVNDPSAHGLVESLIYKIVGLVGGLERAVDYSHLRIVDEPTELGNGGDFWGLYLILEAYNGDLLDEHDYGEGNFWGNTESPRMRVLDHQGDFPGSGSVATYYPPNQSTTSEREHIGLGSSATDLMFDDRIANVIYGQHGNNYIGKHSYNEYIDGDTGTRLGWWGDMDNAFGAAGDGSVECPDHPVQCEDYLVFPRSYCSPLRHVDNNLIVPDNMRIEYQNRMRSVYDLLMNGDHDGSSGVDPWEQIDYLVDVEVDNIWTDGGNTPDWVQADQARWGQTYDQGNIFNQIQWYKDWFHARAGYMANNNSSSGNTDAVNGTQVFIDVDDDVFDSRIPNVPTITKIGSGFAIDELTFSNTSFSDPQGPNTFGALEWRIAEWSDPNAANNFYDSRCTPHYEIEAEWESGEILTNSTNITIPSNGLRAGRTYKVRMRHKDNTGRWSHWSDAISFIAEPAANPVDDVIIFTEIHYHPTNGSAEFVEIYNNSAATVNLDGYRFSDGVDFDFPAIDILPGEYKIIIENQTAFEASFGTQYNSSIIGEFDSGSLRNGGEEIKLEFAQVQLDSVRYDNNLPWDPLADEGLHSLALIDLNRDNNIAVNWATQCVSLVTPGAPNNFSGCAAIEDLSGIVINEIGYNAFNQINREFIELKNTGTDTVEIQGLNIPAIGLEVLESHLIPPGGFAVFSKNAVVFENIYGQAPTDQYSGDLNNNGEPIQVFDFFGTLIDNVTYDNAIPWDIAAANGTHSLGLIDSNFDNDSPVNWSRQRNGFEFTPFAQNVFDGSQFTDYTGLEINEIHFRPANGSLEFIELKNNSNRIIFLSDVRFQGVEYTFVDTDLIFPGGFVVVARNSPNFTSFYGFSPNGDYSGALSNTSQPISILDLFGNTIDAVHYSVNSPWDTRTNDNQHSLALKLGSLNNALPNSWSIQCDDFTPFAENNFDDDNDSICNLNDTCPNFDDNLIGTACNDNNPCTIGETYNNCGCSGGVTVDSDNDGVCDVDDVCPNFNDNLIGLSCNDGNPCTTNDIYTTNCLCQGTLSPDSDGDGVCDALDLCSNLDDSLLGQPCDDGIFCFIGSTYQVINGTFCNCTGGFFSDLDNDGICDPADVCPGHDDNIDTDNDGIPDGCDGCEDYILENTGSLITSDKRANINITTNGLVIAPRNITYQANTSVLLTEDFEVRAGAVFEAKIDGCN